MKAKLKDGSSFILLSTLGAGRLKVPEEGIPFCSFHSFGLVL